MEGLAGGARGGDDPGRWYTERFAFYSAFTSLLHATIDNLMRASEIDYLAVTSRTKSIDSFVKKMDRKKYETVTQATDLTGLRIITFIESDAQSAAALIERSFNVHPEQSLDKSEELGESQVGYRSIHLVCELAKDRASLPEYKPFGGLLFEVQIRTVLQHAWAEIDHDRGYKFSGVLPSELRRRLNLLAGQLELADKEFSRLAADVDRYSEELRQKQRVGDLNVELSSISLNDFLTNIVRTHSLNPLTPSEPKKYASVIDELQRFGIKTIADVQQLLSKEFLQELKKHPKMVTTPVGLLRKAMMFADVEKYFTEAWQKNWNSLSQTSKTLLRDRWGKEKSLWVQAMLDKTRSPKPPSDL
jgi:putative GTP pyrophosphokinase